MRFTAVHVRVYLLPVTVYGRDSGKCAEPGNIKVIVVTDGDVFWGLVTRASAGWGIPIGKLSLYTACGGHQPYPSGGAGCRNGQPTAA
ncbi:hypothetical protein ACNKHT_11005 [Shigella flexneri]